ncbi:TolC family protein [Candidatus Foliamicus sp.]
MRDTRSSPAFTLVAGLLAVTWLGAADAAEELGLQQAIERTLAHNPELVAFGYQIEASQGRLTQSRIPPAPQLELEAQDFLGTGGVSGVGGAETTLSLGWALERGKRQSYIAAARAGISVLEAEAEIRRLDAATLAALLYLDNLEFQERYALSQQAIEVAEQTVAVLEQRVASGADATADLARAKANLARARLYWADMEHDLTNARHLLAAQWGQLQPDFSGVLGNWRELPPLPGFEALVEQLDRSPDLAAYVSQRRLREAELRLAELRARPDWRASAGIRRLEAQDDYAFTFGLTIPFMAGQRNQGQVREAQANLAQLTAEQAATRVQVEAKLFAIHHEMKHSLMRAEALRDEVLPALRVVAEQAREGYEAGRFSLLELQQLESEILSTRSELVQAAIDARRQQMEIERLTGAIMPRPNS